MRQQNETRNSYRNYELLSAVRLHQKPTVAKLALILVVYSRRATRVCEIIGSFEQPLF